MAEYATISIKILSGELDTSKCTRDEMHVLNEGAVIYIYYGEKSFYVGQTFQFLTRHSQHLTDTKEQYMEFDYVIVLFGWLVDANAQNDLESKLITYLAADNELLSGNKKRICLNRTMGNKVVDYKNKEDVYAKVLIPFWEDLKAASLVHETSLNDLRQSILFKYSPFTELSLQQAAIIEEILNSNANYLIEGSAGTGKTVLLTNLIARFPEEIRIGVVVKDNWVTSMQRILKAYSIGKNVDVGSAYQLIKNGKQYDAIIVDEAHRLRWGCSKQNHTRSDIFDKNDPQKNELYLLGLKTKRLVLLYDSLQAIRPADIPRVDFERYVNTFTKRSLDKQFRVQINDSSATYTADDFLAGLKHFLELEDKPYDKSVFTNKSPDAYFGIVDTIHELFEYVDGKRNCYPTKQCRVLAGYARRWGSKLGPSHKKYTEYDWIEDENNKWKWNRTHKDWTTLSGSEKEIGSIHAVQGVDLDYVGIIVAKDLTYKDGRLVAVKENYYDVNGTPAIKNFTLEELTQYVKNIYYVLLSRGINGIRVYFEDEAVKKHFMEEVGLYG